MMNAATKLARKRHAEGKGVLDRWFGAGVVIKKRKHTKHNLRWRRRKIAAASRRTNRR